MNNNETHIRAAKKVATLNERLSHQYGIEVNFSSDVTHLKRVLEHYDTKRAFLLNESGEVFALSNPEYAKAVLISEAVRMYLREIAPKRIRRKKKN